MSLEPFDPAESQNEVEPDTNPGYSSDSEIDRIIEDCLRGLIAHGPVKNPSELRSMLPGTDVEVEIRQFVLTELIKLDMALIAEKHTPRRIEKYAESFPDLLSIKALSLDLVMEEIQLRKERGETPSRDEYAKRFPRFESMFAHLSGAKEATSAVRKLGRPPDLAANSQIDDFLIIQKLGQGAFAHVYLARQLTMHRLVALKVSRGKDDEPQALAQFDHPNIVRVYDQRHVTDRQVHLLYMQFHPGGTLSDVVTAVRSSDADRQGSILLETIDRRLLSAAQVAPDRSSVRQWLTNTEWPMVVAWIGVQLARALDEAHHHDVLHRDVKPANVLLSAEGIPKLADFNVSFAGAAGRAGAAASFGGSIGYMAPEHLRAIGAKGLDPVEEVREPADLHSLGILLWELWQGKRPFPCEGRPVSWDAVVKQQLESRQQPLEEPVRTGSASERVLEKTLRLALAVEPSDRPKSGAELAGRLRLALHPKAARLFDPGESSFTSRLTRVSVWIIAGLVILLPNIAAGLFNYAYNEHEVGLTEEMTHSLASVATVVNSIAYPLAVVIMIWFARGLARAVRDAREGQPVSRSDLHDTIELGHRAAVIGGTCWAIAGIIYPIVLWWMHPELTVTQMAHFFVSLLICGGVAMIYPFFGLALASTLVYYPRLMRATMQDDEFDARAKTMINRCGYYLLGAAIIPLLGLALIISSESSTKAFMLTAIAASVIGLIAAFAANRLVADTWLQMGEVLSHQTPEVPGENDGTTESGFQIDVVEK